MFYHVLNHGVGRRRLFDRPADYVAFEKTLRDTFLVRPMRPCGFCPMPNHWHLALWPEGDGELANFIRRLTIYARHTLARASGERGRGNAARFRRISLRFWEQQQLNDETWLRSVQDFGRTFRRAAGLPDELFHISVAIDGAHKDLAGPVDQDLWFLTSPAKLPASVRHADAGCLRPPKPTGLLTPGGLLDRESESFLPEFRGPMATPWVASGPDLSGVEKETFPPTRELT